MHIPEVKKPSTPKFVPNPARCHVRVPNKRPPKGATLEERIKNHQAAYERINTKVRLMTRDQIYEFIYTRRVTEVTLRAIEKHHSWLFDWVEAMTQKDVKRYWRSAF